MAVQQTKPNVGLLARALDYQLSMDIKILRQVIWKEIQEWKRTMYSAEDHEDKLGVMGEIYDQIKTTEEEQKWIDSQIAWFFMRPIPEDILVAYGLKTYENLGKESQLSPPQAKLYQSLKQALTKGENEPPLVEDIPF